MDSSVTPQMFKAAMASFASGVTVITTRDSAGAPLGLTATAFSSVSRDPPLCLVCISREAEAYPALVATQRFAVNLLSSVQEDLSTRFSTHGLDKFDGVSWSPGPATSCPLLRGVITSIECSVEATVPAGDHDVFLGKILGLHVDGGAPLLYFRGRYADLMPRGP